MSKKLLSVVIPTYNMEAYLRRCLDSVTRDDVPSSLELIIVNDGSTDNSLAIMQEYAKKRPDIVNIIDKPNGHYGSCVNAALKIATGKYIRILDADDWFDTNALIELLRKIKLLDVDLIITPYREYLANNNVKSISSQSAKNFKDGALLDNLINENADILSMHSMTYKTSILNQNGFFMQEGIFYTDTEYATYPLFFVKESIYFCLNLYQYDLTRNGQSMDFKNLISHRNDFYTILIRFFDNIEKITPIANKRLLGILIKYYYLILCCVPKNHTDEEKLRSIDCLLKAKCAHNQKIVYKKLLYLPILWKKFGLHFYLYGYIKQTFHLKNIIFRHE